MAVLKVFNKEGKETGKVDLPEAIFSGGINQRILHQAMVMYQASLRQGTASTKERADVSGGGKKPYRQKGTGRARAGSSRSPLWRGGGVTFGPHPRDFGYTIPTKMKRRALSESLKSKFQSQGLVCIDDFKDKIAKTKEFAKILAALKIKGKVLGLLDGSDASARLAGRNIAGLQIVRAGDVNAYDVIRNKSLLLTRTALTKLLKRIQG